MILDKLRYCLLNLKLGFLILLLFGFYSCSKTPVTVTRTEASVTNEQTNASSIGGGETNVLVNGVNYTNTDLFKSIMFFDGQFATDHLSAYSSYNIASISTSTSVINSVKTVEQRIVDTISVKYPGYLAIFKNKIITGDLDSIQSIMEDAASKIFIVAKGLTSSTDAQLNSKLDSAKIALPASNYSTVASYKTALSNYVAAKPKPAGSFAVTYDVFVAVGSVIAAGLVAVIALVLVVEAAPPTNPTQNITTYTSSSYRSDIAAVFN